MKKLPRSLAQTEAIFAWHCYATKGVGKNGIIEYTASDICDCFGCSKPKAISLMREFSMNSGHYMYSCPYRRNAIMWRAEFSVSGYDFEHCEMLTRLWLPNWFTEKLF